MTVTFDKSTNRFRDSVSGKVVSDKELMANADANTLLLLKAISQLGDNVKTGNKQTKRIANKRSQTEIGIEMLLMWLIFAGAYLLPGFVNAVVDPIGAVGEAIRGTEELYAKMAEVGDVVNGYVITSGYGNREAPIAGASTDHKGVDLGTPEGQTLSMIGFGDGQVVCEDQPDGAGLYATITPAGMPFTFRAMHLSQCTDGTYRPGQIFASTGNTGNSSGPHLHWEQLENGEHVKPSLGPLQWTITGSPPPGSYEVIAQSGVASATGTANDLYDRIVQQESGGVATVVNSIGMLGLGQVDPANVPEWSQQCLGKSVTPDEFLADASTQEAIIRCQLDLKMKAANDAGYTGREACRYAAAIWYSGQGDLKDNTSFQSGGPSIKDYADQVCAGYGQ